MLRINGINAACTTGAGMHGGSAEGKYPLTGNSVPWIMFDLKTGELQLSGQSSSAGRTWPCRNPRKAIRGLGAVTFFPKSKITNSLLPCLLHTFAYQEQSLETQAHTLKLITDIIITTDITAVNRGIKL